MQRSSRLQRTLQLALALVIASYAIGRSYEAALYLSGHVLRSTDACSSSACALVLQLHQWATYLCPPLAIAALAVLLRSTRASLVFAGVFLLLMVLFDLAALFSLWDYYKFSQSFSGPYRDDLLILRLAVPSVGAVLALFLWQNWEPARRAV